MKSKFYILLTMLLACTMQVKGDVSVSNVEEVNVLSGSTSSLCNALCATYNYAASQTLYTSDEIGRRGKISTIAFSVKTAATSAISGSINIYMAESDQMTLTTSNMLDKASMTLVYSSSSYAFAQATGWETITLTTPFDYSGTKNLVVAIESSKAEVNSGLIYYNTYVASSKKAIRRYSNSNTNYATAFDATGMSSSASRPNLKLGFASQISSTTATDTKSSYHYGLAPYYKYFSSQTMYTPAEIGLNGESGFITEIAYRVASGASSNTISEDIAIYMGESDNSTMSTTNMLGASALSFVYIGSVSSLPTATGWRTFQLTYPFWYSGKKNLVVAVGAERSNYTTSMKYYYHETSSNMSITQKADSAAVKDKYTSPFINRNMSATSNVPDTKFTITKTANNCLQIVGTGAAANTNIAFCPNSKNGASQTLYTKQEVGGAGKITKLAYQVRPSTSNSSSMVSISTTVEIYLGEMMEATLTTGNCLTKDKMTKVYSGTITTGSAAGWEEITLQTPYNYTGKKNLVVAVSSTKTTTSSGNYYCFTTTSEKAITSTSSNDPFAGSSMYNNTRSANIRFTFEHECNEYTNAGFAICDRCGMKLSDVLQQPTDITGNSDYSITNVGELMWLAKNVNNGSITSAGKYFYLHKDIDLNGYDWTPIGTDTYPMRSRLYGKERGTTTGHTISGIPSTSSLVGTLSSGYLLSLSLTSGTLVNKGVSGTIAQCLTLGSALVGSGTATISNSYYLSSSSSDGTYGPRTSDQMKSGQVTYELNSYSGSFGRVNWYQTIGSDNYPTVNSSSGTVYRGTKCEKYYYSNNSSDNNKVIDHSWQNAICTACSSAPTTFKQDITLSSSYDYLRTTGATMATGKTLSMDRNFGNTYWQPLYLPFSIEFTSEMSDSFELAEIYAYGVNDDTNNDGNIDSQDQKKLIFQKLEVGDKTQPNTPYMIRKKTSGSYTLTSCDGKLYPAEVNSIECSTIKEKLTVTGSYKQETVYPSDNASIVIRNGNKLTVTGTSQVAGRFSVYYQIANQNGKTWSGELPITFATVGYPSFEIADYGNKTDKYTREFEQEVKNFTYTRPFTGSQPHNWQAMYVPFDITLTDEMLEHTKYAIFLGVKTQNGVECIILKELVAGNTIAANTPCVVCVDQEMSDWSLYFDNVTLKAATSTTKTMTSSQATYKITGVYEPYSNAETEWYAIAKSDGTFHPAGAGAVLPAYRFYMTIQKKNPSAQLRFAFVMMDDEEETGISNVYEGQEPGALYTLDGRKVEEESVRPGIYIKDGKKVSIQ